MKLLHWLPAAMLAATIMAGACSSGGDDSDTPTAPAADDDTTGDDDAASSVGYVVQSPGTDCIAPNAVPLNEGVANISRFTIDGEDTPHQTSWDSSYVIREGALEGLATICVNLLDSGPSAGSLGITIPFGSAEQLTGTATVTVGAAGSYSLDEMGTDTATVLLLACDSWSDEDGTDCLTFTGPRNDLLEGSASAGSANIDNFGTAATSVISGDIDITGTSDDGREVSFAVSFSFDFPDELAPAE